MDLTKEVEDLRKYKKENEKKLKQPKNLQNVDIEEMDLLMKALADLPDPEPTIRRVQLWAHPAVAGLLLLLLTALWICRKAAGLI